MLSNPNKISSDRDDKLNKLNDDNDDNDNNDDDPLNSSQILILANNPNINNNNKLNQDDREESHSSLFVEPYIPSKRLIKSSASLLSDKPLIKKYLTQPIK